MILVPAAMERIFRCRIALPVYLFCLVYAIGPMLGHSCGWYYMGFHWDKVLHIFGGLAFALFGIFLYETFGGRRECCGKRQKLMAAAFGFFLSVAVSALWEFVEFSMDLLWQMEMQTDTILADGSRDIGLYDTMYDMLLESGGALLVSAGYLLAGGKNRLIRPEETI
ncbi:MAG: hypothetical protein E7223_04155 [Clostridiales bacterium]|nr:hypothetical protein [Clostridiales bacterium]